LSEVLVARSWLQEVDMQTFTPRSWSVNIYAMQTWFTCESAHSRTLVAPKAEDYEPISRYAVRKLYSRCLMILLWWVTDIDAKNQSDSFPNHLILYVDTLRQACLVTVPDRALCDWKSVWGCRCWIIEKCNRKTGLLMLACQQNRSRPTFS